MTTVPCGGTEPQIACQSRHTHTLRVILWTHTFAPVERIYFTSSSHGRLHSCVKPCLRLSGIFLFIQKRDVIALFAQQGPFLSLQKVLVGLTTLLSVPQHQNLQSKSQLRSDSSGVESPSDRLSSRTSTYTRRENRLASLSKTDDDSASKDYKKLYEDALAENEKLKSRLDDSKQELTKIRSQLDRVTQRQDRISERSTVFESEKREKEALEKKVSDMEEELKVLTELKSDNQRLKDENGALIRVISKLSK
ncbi:hypothetical protein ABG768_016066 [Culter alburnus]|uniref:cGMP-dependent protein kinase interacting domain-containing protein n=1 Tax=Culter alburnus TaxID=194366 RepID=A0AAW1Z151_CULAL